MNTLRAEAMERTEPLALEDIHGAVCGAESAVAAPMAVEQAWMPISEAPTNGTRIMLAVFPVGAAAGPASDYYHLATWDGEASHPFVPNYWTHFQYLAAPPLPVIATMEKAC